MAMTLNKNAIGTSEGYGFTFAGTQTLTSPFSGGAFGGLTALSSVTVSGVNLVYNFAYDPSLSGEMTQATMPYGGYFKWVYGSTTYASGLGFTQREVQTRILSTDGTQGSEKQYPFVHESSPGSQGTSRRPTDFRPGRFLPVGGPRGSTVFVTVRRLFPADFSLLDSRSISAILPRHFEQLRQHLWRAV